MLIRITDHHKVLHKNSVVEITIDGSKYQVEYMGYSFQESERPALNHITQEIDLLSASTAELKLNATLTSKEK